MCHAIAGTPAGARVGPDLTHLASRRTIAAGTLPNTRGNLAGWIVDPQRDQARRPHAAQRSSSRRTSRRCSTYLETPQVSDAASSLRADADATPVRRRDRPSSSAPGAATARLLGLAHHRGPQVDRQALHRHRVRLLPARRARGGGDAAAARAAGEHGRSAPTAYNQLFTMHGTTMMFLFAVPVMTAVGTLPRAADGRHAQRGVPAAQRLRLLGLPDRRRCSCTSASSSNTGPDAGWFSYVPLSGPEYCAGQAGGRLGADDHVHRDRRARRPRSR